MGLYAVTLDTRGRAIRAGVPVRGFEGARRQKLADGAADVRVHSTMSEALMDAEASGWACFCCGEPSVGRLCQPCAQDFTLVNCKTCNREMLDSQGCGEDGELCATCARPLSDAELARLRAGREGEM